MHQWQAELLEHSSRCMFELSHRPNIPRPSTYFLSSAARDSKHACPPAFSDRPINQSIDRSSDVKKPDHYISVSKELGKPRETKRTDQAGRISFFISYVTTATTCRVQLVKLFATSCDNARRSTANTSLEVMVEPPTPSRPFLQSQPRFISVAALPFSCDCAK